MVEPGREGGEGRVRGVRRGGWDSGWRIVLQAYVIHTMPDDYGQSSVDDVRIPTASIRLQYYYV